MLYIILLIMGALLSYFLPWWIFVPVAVAVAYWKGKNAKSAALASAAAFSTLWVGYSLYLNYSADVQLMNTVGQILTGENSVIPAGAALLVLITLLSGALGALAGIAGVNIRTFFNNSFRKKTTLK